MVFRFTPFHFKQIIQSSSLVETLQWFQFFSNINIESISVVITWSKNTSKVTWFFPLAQSHVCSPLLQPYNILLYLIHGISAEVLVKVKFLTMNMVHFLVGLNHRCCCCCFFFFHEPNLYNDINPVMQCWQLSILHLFSNLVAQDFVPVNLGARHRKLSA